jgi:hypothetical protein
MIYAIIIAQILYSKEIFLIASSSTSLHFLDFHERENIISPIFVGINVARNYRLIIIKISDIFEFCLFL